MLLSLPSIKDINDYKTLLFSMLILSTIPNFIFPQSSLFPQETLSFSSLHNFFPVVPLGHPGYCISFCCPSIGGILVGNVLLLVSGLHMLHFCKLVDVHFLNIKCPWVSLKCPIRILLNLTSYCLQLLYALSHSSMCGLI